MRSHTVPRSLGISKAKEAERDTASALSRIIAMIKVFYNTPHNKSRRKR
jgi:hypothetical protein